MTIFKKLPGVLSFQRCMFSTDALFYNLFDNEKTTPLYVTRHGIRGTQNVNKSGSSKAESSTAGSAKNENITNVQMTDSAKLENGAKLQVRFDLRFIDLKDALFACAGGKNDKDVEIRRFREAVGEFIEKAKTSNGLFELACRYVRNMANGRFLWRNRTVAQSIRITIESVENGKVDKQASFDALDMPLNEFGNYSESEKDIAQIIVDGFNGNRNTLLKITAEVDMGVNGPVEVFPSQNYLEGKPKGFARSLYYIGGNRFFDRETTDITLRGQAALRDQKVSNALRTIDTWYPDFEKRKWPIPVEPNGANLDAQQFFRNTKDSSGFRLMEKITEIDPDTEDGMFLLACIIRGGVYSGSDN